MAMNKVVVSFGKYRVVELRSSSNSSPYGYVLENEDGRDAMDNPRWVTVLQTNQDGKPSGSFDEATYTEEGALLVQVAKQAWRIDTLESRVEKLQAQDAVGVGG